MGLRRQQRRLRQRHRGPASVVRLRNVLDERLRRPGDQRQFDAGPVFADRVVDDRPSLEQRLRLLLTQHQPIRGLPDRHLADVADEQRPLSAAGRRDHHLAHVLLARRSDDVEISGDFVAKIAVDDAEVERGRQREAAYVAAIGHEGHHILEHHPVLGGAVAPLDAQQPAGNHASRSARLDACAAERRQQVDRGRARADRNPQRAEPLLHRRDRVVADPGDLAVAHVDRRQRLEHIVQLRAREPDRDVLPVADVAEVLEVADAGLVEHDPANG